MMMAMFLVVGPLSVSQMAERDGVDWLKWSRVVISGLMVLAGLRYFITPGMKSLTGKLLALSLVYTAAAVWSSSPIWGILFKGLFLASVVGGCCLGAMLNSVGDFRYFSRTMTVAGWISIGGCLWFLLTQEEPLFVLGRLSVAGINPNLLAQSLSIFGLLALFHTLLGDTQLWRIAAGILPIAAFSLVALTGSRGSLVLFVAGVAIMTPALGEKGRQRLVLSIIAVAGLGVATLLCVSEENVDDSSLTSDSVLASRLLDVDELAKDTRLSVWRYGMREYLRHPAVGNGWFNVRDKWRLVQSAYLQIVVETGLMGLSLVVVFVAGAFSRIRWAMQPKRRRQGLSGKLGFVFAATLFALLIHGVFESSLVVGTSPNAIIVAFCTKQLDLLRTSRFAAV